MRWKEAWNTRGCSMASWVHQCRRIGYYFTIAEAQTPQADWPTRRILEPLITEDHRCFNTQGIREEDWMHLSTVAAGTGWHWLRPASVEADLQLVFQSKQRHSPTWVVSGAIRPIHRMFHQSFFRWCFTTSPTHPWRLHVQSRLRTCESRTSSLDLELPLEYGGWW